MAAKGKVGDMLTILRNDGWILLHTRGSHRQFVHPEKSGKVMLNGKPSDVVPVTQWYSMLKGCRTKSCVGQR